jgi:hypothetical protein
MSADILSYNLAQSDADVLICDKLFEVICSELKETERKIWHQHPVWFIDGNPIVGYSKQKRGIRLMFWSGADFEEEKLSDRGKKFKDASTFYNDVNEIETDALKRWLKKSQEIQWDYKNLIKRKGQLERIKF